MVSAEAFTLVAFSVAATAIWCLARLALLKLALVYPAFVFFLFSQVAIATSAYFANVRSSRYAWEYLIFSMLEWLAYGFMTRELYQSIFFRFPGIAILGQWSLYGAFLVTGTTFVFGLASARQKVAQLRTQVVAVEFASHCILFGFAAFILLLLFAISKYPITLHKNVFINVIFFSLVLLGETTILLANQVTSRQLTAGLNMAIGIWGAVCLGTWPLFLSCEGQSETIDVHRELSPEDEVRLLKQLERLSNFILGLARKKSTAI